MTANRGLLKIVSSILSLGTLLTEVTAKSSCIVMLAGVFLGGIVGKLFFDSSLKVCDVDRAWQLGILSD